MYLSFVDFAMYGCIGVY